MQDGSRTRLEGFALGNWGGFCGSGWMLERYGGLRYGEGDGGLSRCRRFRAVVKVVES